MRFNEYFFIKFFKQKWLKEYGQSKTNKKIKQEKTIENYKRWILNHHLKQDLEDLNEDINTLINLYEGKIDISLKQRLRFQWINRLNDYVGQV